MTQGPIRMVRVLRAGEKDDGSFDREFLRNVGAEKILILAWEMVEEAGRMRPRHLGPDIEFKITVRVLIGLIDNRHRIWRDQESWVSGFQKTSIDVEIASRIHQFH
jgi:hypothetical protein